jgi:hypothetical protein
MLVAFNPCPVVLTVLSFLFFSQVHVNLLATEARCFASICQAATALSSFMTRTGWRPTDHI